MSTLAAAWLLAKKDLALFARDRTAMLLTFLLPIVLGTIFGTAMAGMSGGGGGAAPTVELAVEDRDQSEASRALIAALERAKGLEVAPVPDARRKVADGDMPCGLIVPAGYGAGVAAGRVPDLALLRDPSRTIAQQVVLFQLAPVLLERQAEALGAGLMDRILELADFPAEGRGEASAALRESYARIDGVLRQLAASGVLDLASDPAAEQADDAAQAREAADAAEPEDAAGAEQAFDLDLLEELPAFLGLVSEDVAGVDEEGLSRGAGAAHAFASMAVMMLLFSVVGAGGTLLRERAEGTLTRLQLTPAAGRAVLAGKLFSTGLIALAQLVLLFAYGAIFFGVPVLESPFLVVLVSVVWVYLAIGLGILFSVACSSQGQLEGLSTLLILVMSAVGGAWFPREVTPAWFQTVGSITPVAWAMDAYHGVFWYGKELLPTAQRSGIWPQLALMLAVGSVFLVLAFHLYRRRYVLRA